MKISQKNSNQKKELQDKKNIKKEHQDKKKHLKIKLMKFLKRNFKKVKNQQNSKKKDMWNQVVYQLKNHNLEEVIEIVEAEVAVEEEVPVEEIKDKEIAIKIKKHQRLMLMIIAHSQLCDENFWFLMNNS